VLQSYSLKEISSRDLKRKQKGRRFISKICVESTNASHRAHLLKRSSGYPKKTQGTLGGRKTQRRNQLQVAYTRSTESLTSIEPIFFVVAMNSWSIKEKFLAQEYSCSIIFIIFINWVA